MAAVTQPRGCIKFEVDDSKYSSFVPVIGVYIAVTSLVCLLAMLLDICSAFCRKKRWLPCYFFSMNSFTLTLLAIASKLPVDLTTPMPSRLDQFSKLCGNAVICVSMGFLRPSLGLKSFHDSRTNMLSLSVFLFTLVVNTSVQIRTGVIFLFIAEHIIVMCCMLCIICPLWACTWVLRERKNFALDGDKNLLREGTGSMKERLELAYLYGFNHDSQVVISSHFYENFNVAGLCLICSVVLVQAATRNLSLKFCGSSDYGTSIWVTVFAQILIVLIGSWANVYRAWVFCHLYKKVGKDKEGTPSTIAAAINDLMLPFLMLVAISFCGRVLRVLLWILAFPILITVCAILMFNFTVFIGFCLLIRVTSCLTGLRKKRDIDVKPYQKLIEDKGHMSMTYDGFLESVKHMKRWMQSNTKPMENLAGLLLKTQPSQSFHDMKAPEVFLLNGSLQVSSLYLKVLVFIAQKSLPSKFSAPLTQAYKEIEEIIHFIDGRMIDGKHTDYFQLPPSNDSEPDETQFDLYLTALKLREGTLTPLIEFIQGGYSRSTQNRPSDFIEQLFVDMVCRFLSQLPHALYKDVVQSTTAEGFFKSVKTCLGIIRKIEWLETHMRSAKAPIKWSFPEEGHICDLITPQSDSLDVEIHSHIDADNSKNVLLEDDGNAIDEV